MSVGKGFNTYRKSVNLIGSEMTEDPHHSSKYEIPAWHRGPLNTSITEPVPEYVTSEAEEETTLNLFGGGPISGAYNTWIILGRDRVDNRATGYGGKGHTQCGAIDIVVGMGAPHPRKFIKQEDGSWDKVKVDKNFRADAARIYISQKTDIDDNFNLSTDPEMLKNASSKFPSRERSGIAIKADAVRIIGREGIKLVTRTDFKNSQGGIIGSTIGIDLVAGNNAKDLQPMVKGDYLVEALNQMITLIQQLSGLLYTNIQRQKLT